MKRTALILSLLSLSLVALAQAERALRPIFVPNERGQYEELYQGSFALVIGVTDYRAGWPDLPGVRNDIALVETGLRQMGFEVTTVLDPDSQELKNRFDRFISAYGRNPEHRLLVYFAGHGHSQLQSYQKTMGYLVPSDAPLPDEDLNGFLDTALDLQMIEVYARRIQSKHALFLFDSCFSGELLELQRAVPERIAANTSKPVRQLITSGSANEMVPDESVFREQFLEGIRGSADRDQDGYVTGSELGQFLQDRVQARTQQAQNPQYGTLKDPVLAQGDFVFAVQPHLLAAERTRAELEQMQLSRQLSQEKPELLQLSQLLRAQKNAQAGALLLQLSRDSEQARELEIFFAGRSGIEQYELGQIHRKGFGVSADQTKAFRWFQRAAEQNHAESQTMLGWMYRNGKGVQQSNQEALYWYQRAAEQGEEVALLNLAGMFRRGHGTPQNWSKALEYYRKAAARGNQRARQQLEELED